MGYFTDVYSRIDLTENEDSYKSVTTANAMMREEVTPLNVCNLYFRTKSI
jgi:hypothetical protein